MAKKEISKQEMTEKEVKKYFDTIAKHLSKLFDRISNNMGDNNYSIDFLLEQLECEPIPLIYALSCDIDGRGFMKWALQRNIDKNKALLDKITEIEKAHNLPLEFED